MNVHLGNLKLGTRWPIVTSKYVRIPASYNIVLEDGSKQVMKTKLSEKLLRQIQKKFYFIVTTCVRFYRVLRVSSFKYCVISGQYL